ncbi:hypothetical protein [Azospirillum halopraeferens]|uniref:hypothetical protein n=1 Tax=Azospirillum halopraeferens TaxID=34010 RepID=UPI0004076BFD|nr:hypothetical protein [Azospirillum halopraeferens]
MALSVLEVAVYAMVLTAAQPRAFECVAVQPEGVNCTSGMAAVPTKGGGMAFNNGVTVTVTPSRDVVFSNGIRIHLDSSAWAHFKQGDTVLVSVRRMDSRGTRFNFNNGYTCQYIDKDRTMARCFRP